MPEEQLQPVPVVEKPEAQVQQEAPTFTAKLINAAKAGDEPALQALFADRVKELAVQHGIAGAYKIVFLFDDLDSISDFHADRIYSDVSREPDQSLLLLVHSRGGKIEPAYLISKTCKKLSANKFVVAVPRRAKSAATLLALGADEIHLGMMSQLGPIDPQVNDLPALGLANGLTKVAQLVCEYPASAEMWAKYLSENLSLRHLGFLERLGESAAQYAERLLQGKVLPDGQTPKSLANHFVNHYKDHSFLIDIDEAASLLGGVIKTQTVEYAFANDVYRDFNFLAFLLRFFQQQEVSMIGGVAPDSLGIRKKKDAS
ncbi:SDH family Clp fold serine proteinase [Hydrogenophaga palleronii]|uniref:SDH family Clp fold serine proteinase n=1 Tax=Hydrogenophaga palleronii TaxID=65655 RepID=UPI0009FD96EA|nr:hypothetical protein [Hydrogenophaga palleronii]